MLGEAGEKRRGEWGLMRERMLWGLVSHHEDFGFFSGKGKSQCGVLNTGEAGPDSAAPLSFQWIILAVALRLDSGWGLGSQR